MKKYISVCLLAALLTSLAACGGDVGVTDSTDTTAVDTTTDTATVSDLPDMDWGGEEFHVLGLQNTSSTQFSTFEVAVESENGDVVNDAIYRRNVAVEDRYNVKIVETKHNANTGGDAMADVIRKAVLADEDIYDLAFCAIDGIGKLAREGILYDLNELDYDDQTMGEFAEGSE